MSRTRRAVIAAICVAVLAIVGGTVVAVTARDRFQLSASSTAEGTDAASLVDGAERGDGAWSSVAEARGAWVRMDWPAPTEVDRLVVRGATFSGALLRFSDGSSLFVSPDSAGDAHIEFTPREIDSAQLTVSDLADDAAADSVSLTGWELDGGAAEAPGTGRPETATATSGSDAAALVDRTGDSLGDEWKAESTAAEASVEIVWSGSREVASVQIAGPTATAFDPAYASASPLSGTLVFSDGSEVLVSGIAGGAGAPATVAFAPRVVTSITLELRTTISQAAIALREVIVGDVGSTPARWEPPADSTYESSLVSSADDKTCSTERTAFGASPAGLSLVCPAPSTRVEGEAVIVVAAPAGTRLDGTSWVPLGDAVGVGSMTSVTSGVADADGRAELVVDATLLPHGPVTIKVTTADALFDTLEVPLYVQLYNDGGHALPETEYAPSGMTLQWDEGFDSPVSATQSGVGADYSATKPAYWGGSEFGEAVFVDPAAGDGTIGTIDDEFLRIRAQPLGDGTDPYGWGREHTGGILASLDVGASGFSAQYGYFEARMLGPGGAGTWPAFWMLNSESVTKGSTTSSEVDAVELYGHNTLNSCHSMHNWNSGDDDADISCIDPNGAEDWAMTWHTYGVQITPNGATYYLDGAVVATHTDLVHSSEPFYFLVNLALGGGWPIDLAATGDTVDLYVDYIRVYT